MTCLQLTRVPAGMELWPTLRLVFLAFGNSSAPGLKRNGHVTRLLDTVGLFSCTIELASDPGMHTSILSVTLFKAVILPDFD